MFLAETPAYSENPPLPAREPAPALMNYARALRAIGQDLTDLFPKVLEIETNGMLFEARGHSHPNPFHQVRESALKKAWNKLRGRDTKVDSIIPELSKATFTRTYTPEDIERLDRLYAGNRTGQQKKPDNYSLAERLRTMGGIVSSRQGRLKQLRKNADHLYVDYWDQDGKIQTATLTTVILYRNEQPIESRDNGYAPRELWEGYDF
jgi:hypothetical protein